MRSLHWAYPSQSECTNAEATQSSSITPTLSDSTLTPTELVALESVIDRHGIENVLMALSEICGLKAEHIAVNWQDTSLAKR